MTTLRQAREQYFAASGFDEATYTADWVEFKLGPIPARFPNTPARKRVVPLHDLHHALTGYRADLSGEAEIGAWEVASGIGFGCWVGWYLDLLGMSGGVLFRPVRTFRAFVRGRHCENFYGRPFDPTVLDEDVERVRERMGLNRPIRATPLDVLLYIPTVTIGFAVGFVTLPFIPVMIALGVANEMMKRQRVKTCVREEEGPVVRFHQPAAGVQSD